jgi:tetratricopeptide (TPR) repeat protein
MLLPAGEIPKAGITVKHIITGEDVFLSAYIIAVFLITTVADFVDQRFSWQDQLFGNDDAKMRFTDADPGYLWPGDGKPGLWVNWSIQLAKMVKQANIPNIVIPPLFELFQEPFPKENEIKSRDLYWEIINSYCQSSKSNEAIEILSQVCQLNNFIAEPHALLAQLFIQKKEFEKAEIHASKALKLLEYWGTSWDKHMSWEGWIAWVRVLLTNIKEKKWPTTSHGIISLGLV